MRDSNPRVRCLIYSQVQSPLCQSTKMLITASYR